MLHNKKKVAFVSLLDDGLPLIYNIYVCVCVYRNSKNSVTVVLHLWVRMDPACFGRDTKNERSVTSAVRLRGQGISQGKALVQTQIFEKRNSLEEGLTTYQECRSFIDDAILLHTWNRQRGEVQYLVFIALFRRGGHENPKDNKEGGAVWQAQTHHGAVPCRRNIASLDQLAQWRSWSKRIKFPRNQPLER